MTDPYVVERLDEAVTVMFAEPESALPAADPELAELLSVAAELRSLPDPRFRAWLKADLMTTLADPDVARRPLPRPFPVVPKLVAAPAFFAAQSLYPVRRQNFLASMAIHAAVIALVLGASVWFAEHRPRVEVVTAKLVEPSLSDFVLPPSPTEAGGGGGGGDHDRLQAPHGASPKFSDRQLAPPSAVVRNPNPKLGVEPTVVAPPQLQLPQIGALGDPLSHVVGPPSNGIGSGGGIGSGTGGGVGSGLGPGVGPGQNGGIGGGVYRVGGGVSAPRVTYDPDPQYSDEARKAKFQGVVVLWAIIDADGKPRDLKVARSLGMGLDEKAIEAVRKWRFQPAMKDGRPVAVQVNIEVSFRLY